MCALTPVLAAALREARDSAPVVTLTPWQVKDLGAIVAVWNEDRIARALPPLSWDDALTKILETTRMLVT